jgi:predicted nuclease of restriction endonuclease-like RecB superfamily
MLTSDQSIVDYTRGQAIPDRLTRITHRHYLAYAQRMLTLYANGVGRTRRELHRAVEQIFAEEPDCDRRRIASFCKLLDDASEFDTDRKGESAKLRLRVFDLAAKAHPLVTEPDHIFERSEGETKSRIATEIGRPWSDIEQALYADVMSEQRLISFTGFADAQALLSRYNLAQLQACLYKAKSMTVHANADFAAIVRWAKLARLLVDVWRVSHDQYRIDLSGPASVLHETRRYGVNFARFTAALVACRAWEMRASVMTRWGQPARLKLTSEDGYRSHVPTPADFDSNIEQALAAKWGDEQAGWKLVREAGILQDAQATFVPDFLLRHTDGREAFLEIVGFWTPEYLTKKRQTIARFRNRKIVLAVARSQAKTDEGPGLLTYKTRIKPQKVVEAVEGLFADGVA